MESTRYELTIEATYLPKWGCFEGCREIIQNAKDSEIQYSAPMTIKYDNGTLFVKNDGVVLPKEVLLLGHTTKLTNANLIGQFGEGLKVSCIALLRQGLEIKIITGNEVWIPKIDNSSVYKAKVLVFDVYETLTTKNEIIFEINGLTVDHWVELQKKLLFIREYPKENIKCDHGHILLDKEYKGYIFVKGMFVSVNPDFKFGYDFNVANLDRDRRMIPCLSDKSSTLLSDAINTGLLAKEVLELMINKAEESSHITNWKVNDVGACVLADEFTKIHPGYVPVENKIQLIEIEKHGKRGIIVSWNLRTILERQLGPIENYIKELSLSCIKEYDVKELTLSEFNIYIRSMYIIINTAKKLNEPEISFDKVKIVDFTKETLYGTYTFNTGTIRISRKNLTSIAQTLYTLIHEAAHVHGYDHTNEHEEAIRKYTIEIFGKVFN
jgi:hypothetical protein